MNLIPSVSRPAFQTALLISTLALFVAAGPHAAATTRLVPEDYSTIQDAIDHSVSGDTVLIGPGTYRGASNKNIQFRGRNVVVVSRDGPEATIIDCENSGRGFYVHEFEHRTARIQGFTIVNGNVIGLDPNDGGGIHCAVASPMIADCRIFNCLADEGGAIYLGLYGGGLDRCIIQGNVATDLAGAVAMGFGTGIQVTDCLITGNNTTGHGPGGISVYSDSPGNVFRRCTIAANRSAYAAGGIGIGADAFLDRCIVWGNCSPRGSEIYVNGATATLACTAIDTSGVYLASASIEYDDNCVYTDPLFCSAVECAQTVDGDWTLEGASPCVPEHSPCGQRIGARDQGCGPPPEPTGACCLPDGTCVIEQADQCADDGGWYVGDDRPCVPDPCHPTPASVTTWGKIKAQYR